MKTKIKTETMKNITEIYIDLSRCSENQIKELALVMKRTKKLHEKAFDYMSKGETFNHFVCLAQTDSKEWTLWNQNALFNKTELTFPEFIKLFEGGDGENNGWIKIESEADLPKDELDVHFIFEDEKGKYQTFGVWDNKLKSFYSGALKIVNVIYYQPLVKPEPPKF